MEQLPAGRVVSDMYRQPRRPSPVEQALAELEESKREPAVSDQDGKAAIEQTRRLLERSRKAKSDAS